MVVSLGKITPNRLLLGEAIQQARGVIVRKANNLVDTLETLGDRFNQMMRRAAIKHRHID